VWFVRGRGPGYHGDPILVQAVEELDAVLALVIVAGDGAGAVIDVSIADDAS